MAQTYTRQSSIADGDTITASLFNDEYNQLLNAFVYSSSSASATGHRHDGTAAQGGNIHTIGDLDFLNKILVTGNTWEFYVEVSSAAAKQMVLQDGALVPNADSDLDLGTSSVYFKDAFIDSITTTGNVAVGGNLTVTGTTTFNGGTLTLGDSAADNVVFGADVDSNIIPDDDGAYDLGSSSQEWRDLYIDGTAHIDTLDVDVNATIAGTLGVTGVLTGTSLDISGDIDVDGTTNLDVVDIDGAVDMASTLAVAGVLTGASLDISGDIDIDGTSNLDIVDIDGAVDMATTLAVGGEITAASLDISGNVDIDGTLETDALSINGTAVTSTAAELNILDGVTSTAAELNILDGVTSTAAEINILDGVTSTAAEINVLDGITSTVAELNILDGVTASAADINLIDGITNGTVIASKALIADANIDITGGRNITISGELDAATLDISGDADIDGTLEADAITIAGVTLAETISDTVGAMVTSNTESGIAVAYQDADNTLDFTVGTLNQDTTGTAAIATTVTITDNESTNENNALIFTAGGDLDGGNLGLESDGDLKYNPSTGTLSATNISVSGTLSTVDSVTMSANNAVVFEGATADAHETTLTSVDATADRTITLPNVSGTVPVLAAASNTQITSTPEELNILDGVTATATELNLIDGVTATTAELNILDGVTSTAAELNILDGVTATTAELNILDGVTSNATQLNLFSGVTTTAAELNALDGITAVVGELNALDIGSTAVGTAVASKAVILDSNKDYTGLRNLTITGELDAATLDISGAVDMATTALVTGVLTTTAATVFNGGFASNAVSTISTADNADTLTLISTDADANSGPNLNLYRNSASPADDDNIGDITFTSMNDAGTSEKWEAYRINTQSSDVSNGAEDAQVRHLLMRAGSEVEYIRMNPTGYVFNETGVDLDFRVESDGDANMFFVNGGANTVGIGTNAPVDLLHVTNGDRAVDTRIQIQSFGQLPIWHTKYAAGTQSSPTVATSGTELSRFAVSSWDGTDYSQSAAQIRVVASADHADNSAPSFMAFDTNSTTRLATEKMRIDSSGNVGIGNTSMSSYDSNARNLVVGSGTGDEGMTIASGSGSGGRLYFADGTGSDAEKADGYIFYNHASQYMAFGTAGGTERMRITSAGNVGIGITDPASISGAAGEILEIAGSNPEIVWTDTAGTENSMSMYYLNNAMYFHNTESNDTSLYFKANGNVIMKGLNTTGSTGNRYPLYWVHTGTVGSVEPYTGSIRAMKKDITDMSSVSWIHSLTPRSFKFRDYTQAEDGTRTYLETTNDLPNTEYGLIADEVDAVSGSDYILDKDDDDNLKGVLYHNLVPVLLKAVQELKTELDAAKARITTLEG